MGIEDKKKVTEQTYYAVRNIAGDWILHQTTCGVTMPLLYTDKDKAIQENLWMDEQPYQWDIIEVKLVVVK